ncbi:MAG TPA: HAD family hydrolase [Candidatus Aphodoplasma excrementigallinarum]|uniref:HAD family hydrolase n=1 Tax=Candidatus Aphodoplasma excrementigallinarum TaxID=2840673 RepID=A0A9D1T0H1_9FIRM|nr:HAD family hydrolase [Candidatus Aphodoplasma excrementigallinarum]
MRYPSMILFDYGHTLIYEKEEGTLCGTRALMPYIRKNPNNYTAEQIVSHANRFYDAAGAPIRSAGLDYHNLIYQHLLYAYLEIEFSCTPEEVETIFWDNAYPGEPMPGARELIRFLNNSGIRTGVISNMAFSSKSLRARLDRMLPENQFEFIITSSEYLFRKPNKILFELALRKARLSASDVWFCGDNVEADILGAAEAGIYPVWYESSLACPYRKQGQHLPNDCDCLHICDWAELTALLQRLP